MAVTIYDIAKKCGISPSSVSKVINNYPTIPEATRQKVLKCMKEMNYIPNVSAKTLSRGKSSIVGILSYLGTNISSFKHNLFVEILDSFQKEMNANNYDLLFVSRNVEGREGTFYENCKSHNVAGVLLFGDMTSEDLQEIIHSDLPKVGFDFMGEEMSSVTSNNYEATKELTKHLISLGHKKIVFVHGEASPITELRVQAFKDAIIEAGIEFNERMLVESRYFDKESVYNVTSNIMRRINPPTAIMFPDDISAIQGLSRIRECGFKVPEDVSITGFDGVQSSQLVSPHLTTVKQDAETIGKLLANELIATMNDKKKGPEHLVVRAALLLGESTDHPNN